MGTRVPIYQLRDGRLYRQCGHATFEALAKQRYCSLVCRNHASYARHAEARREARREHYRQQKAGA